MTEHHSNRGTEEILEVSQPATSLLDIANQRIAELESELRAERKTIAELLDKAERRDAATSESSALFGAAARMEQIIAERTRELEEKGVALETANSELRDLTDNLDMIVRRRTRALVASEAELRRKNIELSRLNRMKAEFVAIAAHELRTPMTSIVGYIELMLEGRYGELTTAAIRRLKSVHRNADRLMRLIDQMLSVSRIEGGKVTLERAPCRLGDIVAEVVDDLQPLIESKGHTIESTCASKLEITADADKLHQVVANLITNAVRYTPHGGKISIRVDDAPQETHPGTWARLRVRDNGIGIPEGSQGRIFEPFADVRSAKHHSSSEPDSAGLGLYVARGLIDLHGGLITVDSREGEYTEFTVLLPQDDGP